MCGYINKKFRNNCRVTILDPPTSDSSKEQLLLQPRTADLTGPSRGGAPRPRLSHSADRDGDGGGWIWLSGQ